jgi:CheY-like chemotaxis protein
LLQLLMAPDISMPVMDGFEAARQIRHLEKEYRAGLGELARQALPPTIVAALTGLDSLDAQKEAFASGIDTFLIKPVQRLDLYAILQQMEQHD